VQSAYLPTLRGLVALGQKRTPEAIDRLEAARANELGITGIHFVAFFGSLHSAFVRGQALLADGRHADAAAEFQKLLDHRGLVLMDPSGALARLHLGRALARSGDAAGAKRVYRDLLTLWEAADADLAVVQQARAEAAALP
jgi:tetratricopeptide (TPR) repeat protein